MKTTVQLIAAISLCLFGLALMIVSFVMPPQGVIDSSVLVATGEVFTFSGALMGIDYKYRRRLDYGQQTTDRAAVGTADLRNYGN